jgi:DNA-binding transcriptional regulator YdaS (Cro superfamily)
MGNTIKSLKLAIEAAGSQSELARLLGVGPSNVSKWMAWNRVPASQAIKIEFLYGIPASSFFKKK